MPWEEIVTEEECRLCLARGFKNVRLIHETFWYETLRYRKVYSPKEALELGVELGETVPVKGKGYPTDKGPDGKIGLRTRIRCPHWPCRHNQPIRDLNKKLREEREKKKGSKKRRRKN